MSKKHRYSLWLGEPIVGWLQTKKNYNGESASHFVREVLREKMEAELALDHAAQN